MGQDYPKPPASPRKNLHPDAGQGSPVTLRALAELQREQPNFPKMVDIEDFPFDDIMAFTNVNGRVSPDQPNTIKINPALSMLFPQNEVKRTVAHEGQHVNQLRQGREDEMAKGNMKLSYEDRPYEQEAVMVADSYNIPETPLNDPAWYPFNLNQGVLRGLYDSSPLQALRRKLKELK